MKAKREFYMHGNDRKFAEEHLISTMTGEPMPKKWQRFMELTPEEKARWDASLRLDAEYRIAEAQGFPNGIPGGRTRGSGLYTITQMEEEHERELQKKRMEGAREQYEQSFIPCKTEIHNNVNTIYGNINPVNQLWQNPYNTQKNDLTTGISAFSGLQTEKESAFDVNQAIQNLADNLRERWDAATAQPIANTSVQFNEDSSSVDTMNNNVVSDLKQILARNSNKSLSRLELYEILSKYGITYKDIKTAYPDTTQSQFNLLDQEFDPTDTDMLNTFDQIMEQIIKKSEEKRKTNPDDPRLTDYELYEILSPYGARYMQIKKGWLTPEQEEAIRKWVEQFIQDAPMLRRYWRPNETYDRIRDDSFDLSGVHGGGIFSYRSINADTTVTERIWKEIREKLELDEAKICSQLWGFLDEWGKKVLEIALYRIPMPLHIKGALGVILITFAVVEAAKNIREKRKKAIDDFMAETKCSEDVARLEVDKKVNGWVAEEVGKGIIAATLDHFLKEKGLSELTRNFITSAWSSFISSAEFNTWQNQMQEAPQ